MRHTKWKREDHEFQPITTKYTNALARNKNPLLSKPDHRLHRSTQSNVMFSQKIWIKVLSGITVCVSLCVYVYADLQRLQKSHHRQFPFFPPRTWHDHLITKNAPCAFLLWFYSNTAIETDLERVCLFLQKPVPTFSGFLFTLVNLLGHTRWCYLPWHDELLFDLQRTEMMMEANLSCDAVEFDR